MMGRITGGLFGMVATVAILGALWQLNPLYAFVGGIVGMVMMVVVYALFKNQQSGNTAGAILPDVQRRAREESVKQEAPATHRTGEFQAVGDIKKPEHDWETADLPEPQPKPVNRAPSPAPVMPPAPVMSPETDEQTAPLDRRPLPPAPLEQEADKKKAEEIDDFAWLGGLADEDPAEDTGILSFGDVDATDESTPTEEVDTFGTVANRGGDQPTGTRKIDLSGAIGLEGLLPEEFHEVFLKDLAALPSHEQTEENIRAIYEKYARAGEQSQASAVDTTQFTAYYPRHASAGTAYGFYVYAHLPDALVVDDVQQFSKQLGGRVPKPAVADSVAEVQQGAMLTAMVQCEGLQFNQVGAMQPWEAPYTRFDFAFTADETQIDDIINGRVAIFVNMIEIASIDFQVLVGAPNPIAAVSATPDDPRMGIGYEASATANVYQSIFVSYSREDVAVAEAYRQAQMMAGNTVFMDTYSIRAGEDWETALRGFIERADIFQLFWSPASAESEHVRFEWEYALEQRCPDTRCVRFIRPVYWQKPLPDVPEALGHLHFAYVERT